MPSYKCVKCGCNVTKLVTLCVKCADTYYPQSTLNKYENKQKKGSVI